MQGGATLKGNFGIESNYANRAESGNSIDVMLEAERIETAFYFGLGSESTFNSSLWEDGFYDYSRWYILAHIMHGISLKPYSSEKNRFILSYGYQFEYMSADYSTSNNLGQNPPHYQVNGWSNSFTAGLRLDKRDNEFRPSSGYYLRSKITLAPGVISNSNAHAKFFTEFNWYTSFHLFREIVFASRLRTIQAIGDTPLFALPYLGGQYDVRGYPLERFRDKGATSYNLELRTWLFSLPFWEINIGGQLFADGGWVYTDLSEIKPLDGHKWSLGFGGICNVFNPDFLVRTDFGFSDETWRMTIGLGYLF